MACSSSVQLDTSVVIFVTKIAKTKRETQKVLGDHSVIKPLQPYFSADALSPITTNKHISVTVILIYKLYTLSSGSSVFLVDMFFTKKSL